jgi:hypothetical protein
MVSIALKDAPLSDSDVAIISKLPVSIFSIRCEPNLIMKQLVEHRGYFFRKVGFSRHCVHSEMLNTRDISLVK